MYDSMMPDIGKSPMAQATSGPFPTGPGAPGMANSAPVPGVNMRATGLSPLGGMPATNAPPPMGVSMPAPLPSGAEIGARLGFGEPQAPAAPVGGGMADYAQRASNEMGVKNSMASNPAFYGR